MRTVGGIALGLMAAGAASAQGWSGINHMPTGAGMMRQVDTGEVDIRAGRRAGQLTKRQAKDLRKESGMNAELGRRYAADGLSDSERAELRNGSAVLHDLIVNARVKTPPAR